MIRRTESRILPYGVDLLYRVTADVERYPEFLPWCQGLHVLSRVRDGETDVLTAEMTVGFGAFSGRYVSTVVLNDKAHTIFVTQAKGPFRRLDNRWAFSPVPSGTRVDFSIAFEMRNPLMQIAIATAFEPAMRQMVGAFTARASTLAGQERGTEIVPAEA